MNIEKTIFVCDSACVLPRDVPKGFKHELVPLTIIDPAGKTFRDDGVEITLEALAKEIKKGKQYKTSVAPIGVVIETVERLSKTYDHIVYFPLGKQLSGQYAQVKPLEQDFPKLSVIDTNDACLALGYLVEDAWTILAKGGSIADIEKMVKARDKKRTTYFTMESLKGMIASGRISKLLGAVAGRMNVNVIIRYASAIERGGVALGLAKAIKRMVKKAREEFAGRKIKRINVYAGLAEKPMVDLAVKAIKEEFDLDVGQEQIAPVPTIIASYTLFNTIGIFVEAK